MKYNAERIITETKSWFFENIFGKPLLRLMIMGKQKRQKLPVSTRGLYIYEKANRELL